MAANTSWPTAALRAIAWCAAARRFAGRLLEQVDYLSLNVFTIPLEIKRAYTLKGVPISVKAVANVKIKGDDMSLVGGRRALSGHDA